MSLRQIAFEIFAVANRNLAASMLAQRFVAHAETALRQLRRGA